MHLFEIKSGPLETLLRTTVKEAMPTWTTLPNLGKHGEDAVAAAAKFINEYTDPIHHQMVDTWMRIITNMPRRHSIRDIQSRKTTWSGEIYKDLNGLGFPWNEHHRQEMLKAKAMSDPLPKDTFDFAQKMITATQYMAALVKNKKQMDKYQAAVAKAALKELGAPNAA